MDGVVDRVVDRVVDELGNRPSITPGPKTLVAFEDPADDDDEQDSAGDRGRETW